MSGLMRSRPVMGRRVAVLAIALGLVGVVVPPPPATAVGPGDVTPPSYLGALEMTGPITPVSDVILVFDDALDAASIPSGADLQDIEVMVGAVRDNATSAQLSYVGLANAGEIASFVTVQLETSFTDGSNVTVAYTPHGNPIRDQAGNPAGASGPEGLLWLSTDGFEIAFAIADGTYAANHVGLIVPDAAALPLPDPSVFTVTRNSDAPVAATKVSVFPGFGGRILDLEMPICLQVSDSCSLPTRSRERTR